jgi:hypothetical protein
MLEACVACHRTGGCLLSLGAPCVCNVAAWTAGHCAAVAGGCLWLARQRAWPDCGLCAACCMQCFDILIPSVTAMLLALCVVSDAASACWGCWGSAGVAEALSVQHEAGGTLLHLLGSCNRLAAVVHCKHVISLQNMVELVCLIMMIWQESVHQCHAALAMGVSHSTTLPVTAVLQARRLL